MQLDDDVVVVGGWRLVVSVIFLCGSCLEEGVGLNSCPFHPLFI